MKKKIVKKIKKDMTFYELIESNPDAARKLAERGMFCGGCPMAMMETVEQGAMAHGVDVDDLMNELNKKKKSIAKKKVKKR